MAAKVMPYTDATGNSYTESYWFPVYISIDRPSMLARAVFYGYRDATAWAQGKSPIPGAIREYTVSGDNFLRYMTEHLTPGGPNIEQIVYEIALNTKDIPDSSAPTDVTKNKSFFDGATDAA